MPLDDYASVPPPPAPMMSSAPAPMSSMGGLASVVTPPPMMSVAPPPQGPLMSMNNAPVSQAPLSPMMSSASASPPPPRPTFNPFASGIPIAPQGPPVLPGGPLVTKALRLQSPAIQGTNDAWEKIEKDARVPVSERTETPSLSPEKAAAQAPAAQLANYIHTAGGGMPAALVKGYKDFRDASNKADTSKQDALEREALNQNLLEAQRQDILQQQARDAVDAQAAHQKAFEEYQQAHQDQVNAISAAQQQAANARVDPNHFYATRTAGQQIALAIGAALGGALAGLKGGSNTFMDQVNGAIDRDNQAQKFNIDNKWNAVKGKQDMLAAMERNGVDQRNAAVFQRGLQLEAAKAQLDRLAAANQSAEVQKNAAWMRADLDKEIAANNLNATVRTTPVATGIGGALGPVTLAKDLQDRYVPGAGGVAKDSETATKLNAAQADIDKTARLVAEAQAIRERQGFTGRLLDTATHAATFGKYSSADLTRLQQIEGELKADFRKQEQLRLPAGSPLSAESGKLLEEHIGSLTDIGNTGVDARLRGLTNDAKRDLQDLYRSNGIQQIQQGYARDARGNIVPVAGYTGANTGAPGTGNPMPNGFRPAGAP